MMALQYHDEIIGNDEKWSKHCNHISYGPCLDKQMTPKYWAFLRGMDFALQIGDAVLVHANLPSIAVENNKRSIAQLNSGLRMCTANKQLHQKCNDDDLLYNEFLNPGTGKYQTVSTLSAPVVHKSCFLINVFGVTSACAYAGARMYP